MRKLILVLLVLLGGLSLHGQIVNVESLRMNAKGKKLSGIVDLDFTIRKNKGGQTVVTGTELGGQWNITQQSSLMLLSAYHLTQFNDPDDPASPSRIFNNQAFAHLRFNRQLTEEISYEAFTQMQWDQVQEIDLRLLTGLGARFRLFQSDTASFYFGLSYMLEYEETSEREENLTINLDHRINTYISGQMGLNPYLDFNYVLYFQPKPAELSDFRISTNVGLSIRLGRKVNFVTSGALLFDSRPPETVPKTQYHLKNGIRMSF